VAGQEWFSIIASVASITLAAVSIWLAGRAVSQSQANYEKAAETLAKINERSAGTEQIVGEHFEKLMGTMLKIVDTATTSPEVRMAELEYKSKEQEARARDLLFKYLGDALASGDTSKLKDLFTTFAPLVQTQGRQEKK